MKKNYIYTGRGTKKRRIHIFSMVLLYQMKKRYEKTKNVKKVIQNDKNHSRMKLYYKSTNNLIMLQAIC